MKYKINVTTGEITISDLTPEEIEQDTKNGFDKESERLAAIELRKNALRKLELLGLSENEIKALLG